MRQTSFKRLLCMFMAVSAVLVVCVSAFMGYYSLKDLEKQNREYNERTLEEIVKQADIRMEIISENMKRLAEKGSVVSFVGMSSVEKMEAADFLRPLLDSYAETEPSVQAVYLCSRDGILLQGHSNSSEAGNYRLLRAGYRVIQSLPLQDSFRKARYMRVYREGETYYKSDEYLVAVSVPVYGMEYSGALIALVDISNIMEGLTDGTAEILMVYEEEAIWMNGEGFSRDNEDERILVKASDVLPCAVYMRQDTGITFSELMKHFKYNIPMVLCVLIVEVVLLAAIYLRVVRQIDNVAAQMELIGVDSDPAIQRIAVSNRSVNEIVVVARGINGMLARVDELNRRITAGEVNYLNSQIMFLKSQINPHFLFNSLSSIRGMASLGSTEHIRDLTESIANIYHYSMDENVMATVTEEVDCIRLYARTFEARYESRVEIRCDIDAELENARIPRMILQPLAENAFLHAFAKRNFREGVLKIGCTAKSDMIEITLENNLCPPDEKTLAAMNQSMPEKADKRGIGIYNVRRRIELLGGERASLVYRISESGGTQAIITFPKNT